MTLFYSIFAVLNAFVVYDRLASGTVSWITFFNAVMVVYCISKALEGDN